MKNKKIINQNAAKIIIYFILIMFSLMCIIPFLLIISISLSDEKAIVNSGYSLIPRNFTTYAYEYILALPDTVINAYGVSITITIFGAALSVLVTAMIAYPLSRGYLRYRNHIAFYIFFTMLFNGGMVSWYIITSQFLHLRDNILALIIPLIANPWYMLIMKNFFKSVPDALIECAAIEGAGEFRAFWQIAMPLAAPGIATVALFSTLGYWNDWFNALMLITGNQKIVPLQLLLYRMMSNIQYLQSNPEAIQKGMVIPGETARMANCILAIGPIVLVYPFFQKYFISGLTIGAVKE